MSARMNQSFLSADEYGELENGLEGEFNDELNEELNEEYGDDMEMNSETEAEMELAAELLEVSTEEDLEFALMDWVRNAGRTVGRMINTPVGQAVVDGLKGVARTALPFAGRALGNMVVPGVGGAVGGAVGTAISNTFEVDLESMSPENAEVEAAQRFARLSTNAMKNAAAEENKLRRSGRPVTRRVAKLIAQKAIRKAAVQSELVVRAPRVRPQTMSRPSSSMLSNSGRWVRRGSRIIIYL